VGDFDTLSATVGNNLYRIVQEALNNAVRHGQASDIEVQMVRHEHRFSICVADNGSGLPSGAAVPTGMGLKSMLARARAIGAHFDISGNEFGGASVTLHWVSE
jgi:signal transduction histidine kinase